LISNQQKNHKTGNTKVMHYLSRIIKKTHIIALAIFATHQAFAADIVTFSNKSTWAGVVYNTESDNYDNYNWHTGVDNGKVLAWSITDTKATTLSGITYTPSGVFYGIESLTYDSSYLTNQYISWQEGGQGPSANTLTIRLPRQVQAVAFDFGMFRGEVAAFQISLDNGSVINTATMAQQFRFFGLTSQSSFQTLTISASLYPVIDNLAWGNISSSVPEPSAWLLATTGLLVALNAQKKRRAENAKPPHG
jgi:hypothetical protein